jgi:hypothetical protein
VTLNHKLFSIIPVCMGFGLPTTLLLNAEYTWAGALCAVALGCVIGRFYFTPNDPSS